ncbi:MAG: T9SS type A sorting domain-containing protein, partial [Candidatus Edwardsbacteria bacterium]|nr:T9SS type A sorting domain-containing protein [Candidatus Edwardsbacteria bacterium]
QEAIDVNDESWTKYFEASLAALGCRYSAAAIGANKPIYDGYLGQFPAVIWNLGARYQPMAAADLGHLMAYLAGGGRLWLSGQYYLSTNPDTALHPNLWTDYLHLAPENGWYASTAAMVTGTAGDPIGDGIAEVLQYDRLNGGYQYWTDAGHAYALTPDTPAVSGLAGCFKNDDSTYCGLRCHDGTPTGYRLVYTSFPFEAIAGADTRDTLMARVLAWLLDGDIDNAAPGRPAGFTAAQSCDSVVCRWSANTEPDLAGYRVYRSLQEGMPQWQVIGTAGALDSSFADTAIEPNKIYHYAVSAYDDALPANESQWSPWVFLRTTAWVQLGMAGSGGTTVPRHYLLGRCRPNPARGACRIEFGLPSPGPVRLAVYNVTGQRVRTLVDSDLGAGFHSARWDGTADGGGSAAAGVYLYRLEAGGAFAQTRRLMLVK